MALPALGTDLLEYLEFEVQHCQACQKAYYGTRTHSVDVNVDAHACLPRLHVRTEAIGAQVVASG